MRKLISVLLVLVLSTTLLLPAQAATGNVLYQNYDVDSNALTCYGIPLPAGGELTVSYGSEKLAGATLSTIAQAQVPVTIYFLVDTATSLSAEVVQQQLDVLTLISSYMGQEDTMFLATIDDTFTEGPLLTDADARQAAISTISRQDSWRTNLCVGIDAAIDSLSASTVCQTNRYLVVLTDGHDHGIDTVDVEALRSKIAAAHIPVFSLLLGSGNAAGTKELDALNKFSQASLSGAVYHLAKDKLTPAEMADDLWQTIQSTSVIRFSPRSLNTQADAQFLIRYDQEGTRYEDTILVRAVDLSAISTPSTTQPTEVPQEEVEEKASIDPLILAVAAGLVLLIALVTVFLLRRSKKAAPQALDATVPVSDPPVTEPIPYDLDSNGLSVEPCGETKPVVGGIQVSLVALLHPEVACTFPLPEGVETSIGRDERSVIVLNGTDRKLSGVHGAFVWDGAHLLVRDMHSTNGTFLNGTPCAGEAWYLVENGATLQAGGYDYRVTYQA